jgi:hypothetical protein
MWNMKGESLTFLHFIQLLPFILRANTKPKHSLKMGSKLFTTLLLATHAFSFAIPDQHPTATSAIVGRSIDGATKTIITVHSLGAHTCASTVNTALAAATYSADILNATIQLAVAHEPPPALTGFRFQSQGSMAICGLWVYNY